MTAVAVFVQLVWLLAQVGSDALDVRVEERIAGFGERYGHAAVLYDGALHVLGGTGADGGLRSDVWVSEPYETEEEGVWGLRFVEATDEAAFGPRARMPAVSFGGRLWVLGGLGPDGEPLNDVWSSDDGETFVEVPASGPVWPARYGHTALAFDGRLWVLGGRDRRRTFNDVWSSTDGETWTRVLESAPWGPRWDHASVVYDGHMWVLGGIDGDVVRSSLWRSPDGIAWTEVRLSETRFEQGDVDVPETARGVALRAGDTLFVAASREDTGAELYRLDPDSGLSLVADLNPGPASSHPGSFVSAGTRLLFVAHDGTTARLYASDGTSSGTRAVTDGDQPYEDVRLLTAYDGRGAFVSGSRVLVCDGDLPDTGPQARLAVDLASRGGEVRALFGAGRTLYIVYSVPFKPESSLSLGAYGPHGFGGSFTFTETSVDFRGLGTDPGRWAAVLDGTLYFAAHSPATGVEVWSVSDPRREPAPEMETIRGPESGLPRDFTAADGRLYFRALGEAAGAYPAYAEIPDLWSASTPQDLVRVTDAYATHAVPGPPLWVFGERAFFPVSKEGRPEELWTSDGTPSGTGPVKSPATGFPLLYPSENDGVLEYRNHLLFEASDTLHDRRFWMADGNGVILPALSEPEPNPTGSPPSARLQLVAVTGDRVYFRRNAWNGHRQVDELRSFGASGGEEGGVFPLRGHAAAVYGSRIVALGGAGPDPLQPSRTILNDTLWISDNGLSWREAWTASGGSWRQRMAPVLVYYPGPPEGVYVLGGEGAQWFADTYRISTELRAPKADFIVLNPFDRQRLIRFEDRSDPGSLPIARWVWSFGDDTPDYVGPVPPVHRYERPGRYTVTLRVESPAGADEAEKEAYIYIQEE